MVICIVAGSLLGTWLGLHFRASILVPAVFMVVAVVMVGGIAFGIGLRELALTAVLAAGCLQSGYFLGCILWATMVARRAGDGSRLGFPRGGIL